MNIYVEYEWIFMLNMNEYLCWIWMNIYVEVEWIFMLNMNEYFCWSWMNIYVEYEYFSWIWINLLKLNEYFSWIWMQTLEVEQIFSVEFWNKSPTIPERSLSRCIMRLELSLYWRRMFRREGSLEAWACSYNVNFQRFLDVNSWHAQLDVSERIFSVMLIMYIGSPPIYRVSQKNLIHLIFKWITKVSVFFDSPCIWTWLCDWLIIT
jgi:hypothetical protein